MKIFLVGGAVRDLLMGKPMKDRDFVVVGSSEVEMFAHGYKRVGHDFPVFLHPETGEEYALARIEKKTGSGYGGFTTYTLDISLEDDLRRRDFTINAMAIDDETGELFDPLGGQQDIEERILRHVSGAFQEDPVRVLRAARFAARYNFTIASATVLAAQNVAKDDWSAISIDRIYLEVKKAIEDHAFTEFVERIVELHAEHALQRLFGSQFIPVFFLMKQERAIDDQWDLDVLLTQIFLRSTTGAGLAHPQFVKHVALSRLVKQYKRDKTWFSLTDFVGQITTVDADILDQTKTLAKWNFVSKMKEIHSSVNAAEAWAGDASLEGKELGMMIRKLRSEAMRNYMVEANPHLL
jgi:tRNA nucleotidyltransferase/poly(A) polymerase